MKNRDFGDSMNYENIVHGSLAHSMTPYLILRSLEIEAGTPSNNKLSFAGPICSGINVRTSGPYLTPLSTRDLSSRDHSAAVTNKHVNGIPKYC